MDAQQCYYATDKHQHFRLDYSDLSGSDSETASSSTMSSSSDSSSNIIPRRMDLVDLDMVKIINTGGSGKVYLVRDKIDRQHLALKVIPKSRNMFHCNKAKVATEKNIHSFLTMESDDFILPLVATWCDRTNYYLASEYVPGGDLALRIMQQRTFDEVEARFYIAELIVALERLHARKVIHRDIKPSNILIRPDGHIVLADFGISKRFSDPNEDSDDSFYTDSDDSSNSSRCSSALEACHRLGIDISSGSSLDSSAYMTSDDCGTPYFMSPEQHRGDRYSFEVDYWAVGVILYRMVTGKMPFGDCAMNKGQIARSVLEDDVSFVGHSSTISMVTQDFILGLLAKDPCHRLHPSEIRKDPFFYGIDWSLVENRNLKAPWLPYVAPIPKQSRAIFAGYRELSPSSACYIEDSATSFAWYSPYARLRHARSVDSSSGVGGKNSSSSSSAFDVRWKSWIRTVFCASDANGNSRRRRRKGWIAA
ncbi:kinase-like domain-containing protein [Lentinula detonsa]|uniref:non-specific serine/threonine protein kinase n=1 Tax=Lentinula detonsa TaxID=2804962 RepID=A0A9W8TT15_9AGAR|nr:kinase-like domain-containing protein [Lentinula detonsa]